jgi:hypothetical protein
MVDDATEAAKRQLANDRAAQEKRVADAEERQSGKPTPTQEEADLAKLGAHVHEKEDDGSGPERRPGESKEDAKARVDKEGGAIEKKESKPASTSGSYQTRDQQSGRPTPQSRATSGSTENK